MRLWHYKLIPVLPRQQLLGQWRECCLIAKELAKNGTPNHILVNPVIDYPVAQFVAYSKAVYLEMSGRGWYCNKDLFIEHLFGSDMGSGERVWKTTRLGEYVLFPNWHTDKYLTQCYYNLEEKHDRGGMTDSEWKKIVRLYQKLIQ